MERDIAISSRVRVARNIKGRLFPASMSREEGLEVRTLVKAAIGDEFRFEYSDIDDLKNIDRTILVEKRLISKELLKRPEISSFLVDRQENTTIMVNEEDQIRIQSISGGLDLDSAWEKCNRVDDILEAKLEYAFDEEFGYLTSCPSNTGTGLRASVMVHLPILVGNGLVSAIMHSVGRAGITIRGIYGEGSKAVGNLFQISNQTTLGETEQESIEKLRNIVSQIIDRETQAREILCKSSRVELEDRVYRSLGTLTNARIITTDEAMRKLSDIRLGVDLGILKLDLDRIDRLTMEIQPGSVQKKIGDEVSEYRRDIKRAELLRAELI
ncbi:putative ATP:guanido phosphotransferase [Andreesenia angusta]|uniref:Protein-arginine kinase n=1 Tax=Andreesenia angusta TaxID=39480 RepID=A0A1S1V6W1_9FIRM|nr:protein arginine kinase [Andreesenia angusta]OHW62386.1 putative ATP:guanido phosphotransferase [Andreesenia angusta]